MKCSTPALRARAQERRPVDDAAANLRHAMLRTALRILDVHQFAASRPAVEIAQRILTAAHDPVQVQFEAHERRIRGIQQHIEGQHAVERRKIDGVIVISEA